MARTMIRTMGGSEQWAKAKWVYAREQAYFPTRRGDIQFWRQADRPGEKAVGRGPGWSRQWSWDANSGFLERDGERRALTPDEIQERVGWWKGEIYIMYVRLAREDEDLRLVKTGDRSFRVLDKKDGTNLGEFFVDMSGAVSRWKYGFGADEVDYVYGPLKSFGSIKAPSWGALNDGTFRFFYTDFRLAERDDQAVFSE